MSYSSPLFKGKIYTNGYDYAGLFERSRKHAETGAVETQYYFLPTNSSGDVLDDRANVINGYFTNQAAAENSPPYSGEYVDWQNEKYLTLTIAYPFEDLFQTKTAITEWCNEKSGINNIMLPIFWNDVFDVYNASISVGGVPARRQVDNFNSSWAKVDDLVMYAKATGKKVSLLVCLFLARNTESVAYPAVQYATNKYFWGVSNNEMDEYDQGVGITYYGDGHPSLADKSVGSGRSMMKDFFQKVVNRYAQSDKLGSQLNWVSPVITAQMEFGYNYENTVNGLTAKALSGYHPATIAGFRTWLNSMDNPNRYENIEALRSKWGMYFADFNNVTPPITGVPFGTATTAHFAALFTTNRGKDWWLYLAQLLYDFANELKAILNTNAPQAKLVLSFGGNAPSDDLVILRCTYDVIKFSDVSHGIKTAFGIDTRIGKDSVAMSLDYLQNYNNKKQTELHYIDYGDKDANGNVIDPPSVVEERMVSSGKASIQNGAKDLLFVTRKQHGEFYNMLKRVYDRLLPDWLNPPARDTKNRSASVTLGDLLNTGGRSGVQAWESAGGSSGSCVNFKFLNTIGSGGGGGTDLPYSMSLFPEIQTYYFRDDLSRNSYYYTTNPSIQPDYDVNRVPFLVSSHGISYPNTGTIKTKSHITITDQAGVVWVKVIQTAGVNQYENGINYSNNHKELRFPPNAGEDCRFWLPIPPDGGFYNIKIDVFDASCRFDVFHADGNAPGGIIWGPSLESKAYTPAGSSETITLTKSQLNQQNVSQRVVKINNNRWANLP